MGMQTAADVRSMLQGHRGAREVLFTSGEPTLDPDLLRYATWAREEGFESIGVITNGRRLSYGPYARALLEAGVNRVMVSIHGPDARSHDAMTRSRGSFDQTFAALGNLSALRRSFDFRLETSTVVNRRNLGDLADLCRVLAGFDGDRHVFNVMMPEGLGERNFESLMPRYRDVAAAFQEVASKVPADFLARMALVDIPDCTTEMLPPRIRGFVERYAHYDPQGTFRKRTEAFGDAPGVSGSHVEDAVPLMAGERIAFERVERSDQEAIVRTRGPQCDLCRYSATCTGVWKAYVVRFGWEEFVPVSVDVPEFSSPRQ
jgi:MoaA/NifB/PqqE/SkfB family radical SAM enzyme